MNEKEAVTVSDSLHLYFLGILGICLSFQCKMFLDSTINHIKLSMWILNNKLHYHNDYISLTSLGVPPENSVRRCPPLIKRG